MLRAHAPTLTFAIALCPTNWFWVQEVHLRNIKTKVSFLPKPVVAFSVKSVNQVPGLRLDFPSPTPDLLNWNLEGGAVKSVVFNESIFLCVSCNYIMRAIGRYKHKIFIFCLLSRFPMKLTKVAQIASNLTLSCCLKASQQMSPPALTIPPHPIL